MKGIAVTVTITIIFIVLAIITMVAFMPAFQEATKVNYCKTALIEDLEKIKYKACLMSDVDLESIEKVNVPCLNEMIYEEDEKVIKYFIGRKEYAYDVSCPQGFYGFVKFDFSVAGDSKKLIVKEKTYNFLVSQKKANLVFCEGEAMKCSEITEEKECNNQFGCKWSNNLCEGYAKSCYELDKDRCEKQKGCELI
ncbi:MAG: hypothetical protein QXI58_04460 [Candidatus Micrarchaeia archaeon]